MLELRKIKEEELEKIYSIVYNQEIPEWSKYNAPYFEEYEYLTYPQFLEKEASWFFKDSVNGIYVDGEIIGTVSRYYVDKRTRWLEIGIVIYDDKHWGKSYGSEALKLWTKKTFDEIEDIEHIGLTTWSGNFSMMKSAEKAGYTKEAQIRKVRYYKGVYYDSVKYGILREELSYE